MVLQSKSLDFLVPSDCGLPRATWCLEPNMWQSELSESSLEIEVRMVHNGLVDCDGMWVGPVGTSDAADGAIKYGGGRTTCKNQSCFFFRI